ncbi:hypothetical protein JYU34_014680 [Plutella xylostella]|uniref:Major facilitator superfamily (MFS) profile domain-containing protein n=1 Tax=Plutella xylostella TaxID=51655 RepID=A0ABQ7QCK5_PLUXY|nr:hypothetical protein JYU34_014680 [Plutella xylostella]
MSEVNLAAMADADKHKKEFKSPTPMQEMDIALKECKFGLFHVRLLFTAFIAFIANVLVTTSSAYLLPTAECDLGMGLVHKGILNAMPYVGMLLSGIFGGFLTDTFGRRLFLILGYGGTFASTVLAASSQTYEVLITAKFFEGLFFAVSFSPTISYTSEFCHSKIRDRVMLFQSSFIAMAQVIIAVMSWQLLIQDWTITLFDGYLEFNNWNIYLSICSLWSLGATILYALLPESPKYLLSQRKYDEARAVLVRMYVENTRKPADTYPCGSLWQKQAEDVLHEADEHPEQTGLRHQIVTGLHNIKPMFQKPLLATLALLCSTLFLSMAMYNIIRLWFPQLSTIIEHSGMDSNSTGQDLCVLLDNYTQGLKDQALTNPAGANHVCTGKPSGTETYINSIILGSVCVIPYLISGILVNKVGKKNMMFCSAVIAIGVTLGLRYSNTKPLVVALFSIDTAILQIMLSLSQAFVIEFFPTTMRTLAIAILMMVGRIGTLLGNVAFPILLNMGCVIPFFSMAGVLCVVTVVVVFLPSKKT